MLVLDYPFSKSKDLQETYTNFEQTNVRYGLALQDMESLSTHVALKYARTLSKTQKFDLRTVSIDRSTFYSKLNIDRDFRMAGYIIYVGNSSMTVNIDLYQQENSIWQNAGHANFVVSAFDGKGEKVKLPKLSLEGEKSIINNITRYEYGYAIKQNCMTNAVKGDLYGEVPQGEEMG